MNQILNIFDYYNRSPLRNVINMKELQKNFMNYNEILLKRHFHNIFELSEIQSITNIQSLNMQHAEIIAIINDFLEQSILDIIKNEDYLYSIVKITNIPHLRTEKILSHSILLRILKKLQHVSRETKSISLDFLVMRCVDNLILKTKDLLLKNKYKIFKQSIFKKIIIFPYEAENNVNSLVNIFMLNRIYQAAIDRDIIQSEFIKINKKILKILPYDINLMWKNIGILNNLIFQGNYSDTNALRNYKNEDLKQISVFSIQQKIDREIVFNTIFDILAKEFISKEDFYHISDLFYLISNRTEDDKHFALDMCFYVIYLDSKCHIFDNRFIRENFMKKIILIIKNTDSLTIKERELQLLFFMVFSNQIALHHKEIIIHKIIDLLIDLSKCKDKISYTRLYKYYDLINQILMDNPEIKYPEVAQFVKNNIYKKDRVAYRFNNILKKVI